MTDPTRFEAQRYEQHPDDLEVDHPWWRIDELIPNGSTVLDVGCGSGSLGRLLGRRGVVVDGIEANADRAAVARTVLRNVTVGEAGGGDVDLSSVDSQGVGYDYVVFTDVLEHVVDPLGLLRWGRARMGPGGRIIAQIPNSANWRFRLKILRGDWTYEESGFFDRDHVRFFDVHTALGLGSDVGLIAERVDYPSMDLPWKFRYKREWAHELARRYPNIMAAHVQVVWREPG